MTLRIFAEPDKNGGVIALHGRLSAAEVGELEKVIAVQGSSARIDLTCLSGADARGLVALRRLRNRGVRLTGVSPYLELRLEDVSGEDEAPDEEKRAEE